MAIHMSFVPHFDLPFRFVSGHAAVVNQDTLADVTNCVEACLLTIIGERTELPEFGIPDPTFENQPIDLGAITDAVLAQEPRAIILLTQNPDKFDQLIADVLANVSIAPEVTP